MKTSKRYPQDSKLPASFLHDGDLFSEADLEELQDAEWTAADEEYDRRRDEVMDERLREREA